MKISKRMHEKRISRYAKEYAWRHVDEMPLTLPHHGEKKVCPHTIKATREIEQKKNSKKKLFSVV